MYAELYWIDGPWPGRLAIAPRPRGGDWLEGEICSWQQAGIEVVVSTLTTEETEELDLSDEARICRAHGIKYLAFPVADRDVPLSAQVAGVLVRDLEARLQRGDSILIHCRQGVGRSALLAACLLAAAGVDVDKAFDRIGAARGCPVPDTTAQREWVAKFNRDFLAAWPRDVQ